MMLGSSFQRPGMRRFVQLAETNDNSAEGTQVPLMLSDDEKIDFQLCDVALCFDPKKGPIGQGTLFITSRRVVWLSHEKAAFDFDVPYIVLHAVCRDETSYPLPCVYCQLDCDEDNDFCGHMFNHGEEDAVGDEGDITGNAGHDVTIENVEENTISEMYIVPKEEADVISLFDALSHAAMMNPDPPDEGADEDDDELIFDVDEVKLGAEQARTLQHLESVFVLPSDPEIKENDDVKTADEETLKFQH